MKKITILFLLCITSVCLAGIPIDSVNAWKRQADKLKTDLNTYETIRIYAKAKSLTGIPIDSVNAWKNQAAKDKIDLNTYITGLILLTPAGTSGAITGTITANYIPVATGTNTIKNSLLYQNNNYIGIGSTTPTAKFEISNPVYTTTLNLLEVKNNVLDHSVFKITDIGASAGSSITSDFGYWGLGTSADLGGNRLTIKGSTSGVSTGALVVFNSSNQINLLVFDNGQILAPHLPTSPVGLSSGQIWNNLGVLNIVP